MNDPRDREELLNEVLLEPGDADLRSELLSRTLRHVKRHRVLRHVRQAGAALAAVAVLGILVWRVTLPTIPGMPESQRPYLLVRTQTLPPSALTETRLLGAESLVASTQSPNLSVVTTGLEQRPYAEIDDSALLAFARTNAAVLVRLSPQSAELVFVPESVLRPASVAN